MAINEEVALERPPDKFLDLIEKFIANKDVDAEKLKVLVDLQIQLEDRYAEKQFNGAMIEARSEIQGIAWDKINPHTKSQYASYPKIDEALRPVMERHGFTITFGAQPTEQPNMMIMYADVLHVAGHTKRYPLPMPIDNKGPQGGTGVMTGPQAIGNGTSYGMRYLVKLIFNIPMLVDKDDNDGNPVQGNTVTEAQVKELRKLFDKLKAPRQRKALEHFKLAIPEDEPLHTALAKMRPSEYNNALKTLASALRSEGANATIDEKQEATLVALIEGIGGTCKADFLKTNQIKKVSELPANQYQGALAALEQQRSK